MMNGTDEPPPPFEPTPSNNPQVSSPQTEVGESETVTASLSGTSNSSGLDNDNTCDDIESNNVVAPVPENQNNGADNSSSSSSIAGRTNDEQHEMQVSKKPSIKKEKEVVGSGPDDDVDDIAAIFKAVSGEKSLSKSSSAVSVSQKRETSIRFDLESTTTTRVTVDDDYGDDEEEEVAPPRTTRVNSSTGTLLSENSQKFDFDGDGILNEEEQRVKNICEAGADSTSRLRQNVYAMAKEGSSAKREAGLFRKIAIFFSIMNILLMAATFGLVFVAVNLTKDSKVNSQAQLVSKDDQSSVVATLGSSSVAFATVDPMYGKPVDDYENSTSFFAGTIPRQNVEQIFNVRRSGVQGISTEVQYGTDTDVTNWVVYGDIVLHRESTRVIYNNLQVNILPGWVFTVICVNTNDLCAITQSYPELVAKEQVSRMLAQELSVSRADSDSQTVSDLVGRGDTGRDSTTSGTNREQVSRGDDLNDTESYNRTDIRGEDLTEEELQALKVIGEKKDPTLKFYDRPAQLRRRMTINNRDKQKNNIWYREISLDCWLSHYKLALLFQNHFFLVAIPINYNEDDDDDNNCPIVAVDADYMQDPKRPIKKATILRDGLDEVEQENLFELTSDHNDIPFKTIASAVSRAQLSNTNDNQFNILSNNCGTLILNVLNQLEMEFPAEAMYYVVEQIMETDAILDSITNSYDATYTGFTTRRLLGDRAIVQSVVQNYIQDHTDDL